MGAHSSLHITRSKAKELCLKNPQEELSDKQLEDILTKTLSKITNKVIVVNDDQDNENNLVVRYYKKLLQAKPEPEPGI